MKGIDKCNVQHNGSCEPCSGCYECDSSAWGWTGAEPVNCTPHSVTDVESGKTYKACGLVLRIVDGWLDHEPTAAPTIVSGMVLDAVGWAYPQLAAPGELVRDSAGQPIGCKGMRSFVGRRDIACLRWALGGKGGEYVMSALDLRQCAYMGEIGNSVSSLTEVMCEVYPQQAAMIRSAFSRVYAPTTQCNCGSGQHVGTCDRKTGFCG